MPANSAIAELGARLRAEARAAHERRALALAGSRDWCHETAQALLAGAGIRAPVWLARSAPCGTAVPAERAGTLLGGEIDALVVDCHDGLDPDGLGAAAGAVVGGGLLLILTPPLAAWPAFADPQKGRIAVHPLTGDVVSARYAPRLARLLRAGPLLEQGAQLPRSCRPAFSSPQAREVQVCSPPEDSDCITADQACAVAAVLHVARGHRDRPLVITSDRGRGKSAALGIAAARLLAEAHASRGPYRIVVTAPRPAAVEALFAHAQRLLPAAARHEGRLGLAAGTLEFVAPDRLADQEIQADLVLVDEAAAIPLALLERLLARHHRIVFSTTVHGYEGSGRGFALRFRALLAELRPGFREIRLEQPVRWSGSDPVEPWLFRLLLLDAEPSPGSIGGGGALVCERVDRDALACDEALLQELFGLLVTAHYRTRPFDLRHLLDGTNVAVWVARRGGRPVATALVAAEGGLDPALAAEVVAGRRRPRGHLIPQSLATHMGIEAAARLRCARVMRIAVHPELQGQGIGSDLLEAIARHSLAAGFDTLGSSFGGSGRLLRFWARNDFEPVRTGLTREASSGAPSVMVLRALTAAGEQLYRQARQRFARSLPELLGEPLATLEPSLAAALVAAAGYGEPDAESAGEVAAFGRGELGYEMALPGLRAFALHALANTALSDRQRAVLVLRVVQRRPWAEVAARLGLAGRAGVEAALRAVVSMDG